MARAEDTNAGAAGPGQRASDYEARLVRRRGLALLRPLFDAFGETGVSQWDGETLERVAWLRVVDPHFRLWAVVRRGATEPVGFLAAQEQPGVQGPEVFVLAAYVQPSLSAERGTLAASAALHRALLRWARSLGVHRITARTSRGDAGGLAEPRAWERYGFRYDSTILVLDLTEE